jgi:putative endopeptidase
VAGRQCDPGDRTSWGAFEMLDERSTAVQRQLAEQAAAMKDATGVEKIVGDLWATGMDEPRSTPRASSRSRPISTRSTRSPTRRRSPSYLRTSAAKGEATCSASARTPTSRIPHQHRLRHPGRPGPARQGLLLRQADKADKLAAYVAHIAKVLELSGIAAADAAKQAADVMAFEKRLAKVSKSSESCRAT